MNNNKITSVTERSSEVRKRIDDANATSRSNMAVVHSEAIRSEVFNTNLFTPTQTAYAVALHFDFLPARLHQWVVTELVADIECRDTHLSAGFVGTPYLPHALSENGHLEAVYALLFRKSCPHGCVGSGDATEQIKPGSRRRTTLPC